MRTTVVDGVEMTYDGAKVSFWGYSFHYPKYSIMLYPQDAKLLDDPGYIEALKFAAVHLDDMSCLVCDHEQEEYMRQETEWAAQSRPAKRHPGYVYVVQAIEPSGHYKIGRSKDPQRRIESMGVKLPYPINIICLIKTDNMLKLEKALHRRHEEQRVNGEWFALDQEHVEYLKSLKEVNYHE